MCVLSQVAETAAEQVRHITLLKLVDFFFRITHPCTLVHTHIHPTHIHSLTPFNSTHLHSFNPSSFTQPTFHSFHSVIHSTHFSFIDLLFIQSPAFIHSTHFSFTQPTFIHSTHLHSLHPLSLNRPPSLTYPLIPSTTLNPSFNFSFNRPPQPLIPSTTLTPSFNFSFNRPPSLTQPLIHSTTLTPSFTAATQLWRSAAALQPHAA